MLLMEAPGPPAIWHNPTSMAKLMQLGMEQACDLQALCHVGENFFSFIFPLPLESHHLLTHIWWSQGIHLPSLAFLWQSTLARKQFVAGF